MKRILMAATATLALALPLGQVAPAQASPHNVVVEWNQVMLSALASANLPPPPGNRIGAIVQAAVFDAVNGVQRRYTPIHVAPAAPEDASPRAAAAGAAYVALVSLFPAQKPALDNALGASLAVIADGDGATGLADGLAWGKSVGARLVAWRAGDGFNVAPPPYVFSTAPGVWQPTPGGSGAPKFRSLATTAPFGLASPSQFRPGGPPALTSDRYARDFNEIKALGSVNSSQRSAYQTQTARFWQLDTPTAMWDRVADALVLQHHSNLLQSARLLALVNISIADSTIAIFDAKNVYNSWRPITAIVDAANDGNSDTTADPAWMPLMTTPYFQEYPSAHSGVSSAAASVLAATFGEATSFTVTSAGLPGVERTFSTFSDAVGEVADSRVYAGFHFRFSCDDAITLGMRVAGYVQANLMLPARD